MAIGGGFHALHSVLHYAWQIGPFKLWQSLRSKNACKACAFGTGGQNGGLKNEAARSFEVCNKNIQAHTSDIRPGIPAQYFLQTPISAMARLSGKKMEALGRLTLPLYKPAGAKHYSPLSVDEAINLAASRLKAIKPERSFFYASGRSSNEAAFALQLLARLYGTNHINNCSYYCHQASGVGLKACLGTSTATVTFEDLNLADCIFVWGANPASNHPRFVKLLLQARRRGVKVVVINPAQEAGLLRFASPSDWRSMLAGGSQVSSLYIQPHLGGDSALMAAMAKLLIEQNALNEGFIANYTEGFDEFKTAISALNWDDLIAQAGVSYEQIKTLVNLYQNSERCIFAWSMGLTHHTQGVGNIEGLAALALLRGQIGKPGAGLLPLRGHSNIQGTGSMGFTPQLQASTLAALEQQLGFNLTQAAGLDSMACMQAAHDGQMDALVGLGGNLWAANPDTAFTREALNRIGFKCFLTTTLNHSHVEGIDGEVVIFPVRARDEEAAPTSQESMFNFVRLSDGGIERFPQLLSEIDIIARIGQQLINAAQFDFGLLKNPKTLRQWIAKVIPGYQALAKVDENKQEFTVGGRILHSPEFATASGKAQFKFSPLPIYEAGYRLTSVRSEGQFNSIIYHEQDAYREQTERWVVMMHPEDMAKEGLKENQTINLTTATGSMQALKVKPYNIRPGNLMVYYPEANQLIPRAVDTRSKTPGFKSVVVRLSLRN
ncbi:MAG TPA: FdhF/YdeP family oxidoreductase [Cellvibrionaceae bacterium]|nr:FdhF/YdeP family oxidoreductase [Cellvibrionaceae bacterium]HNG58244.1 FdhF/YdeP family oxidoreductase [Cellvibrionaceae bacterium]